MYFPNYLLESQYLTFSHSENIYKVIFTIILSSTWGTFVGKNVSNLLSWEDKLLWHKYVLRGSKVSGRFSLLLSTLCIYRINHKFFHLQQKISFSNLWVNIDCWALDSWHLKIKTNQTTNEKQSTGQKNEKTQKTRIC